MTLAEYLKHKYGPFPIALSKPEAKVFGIKYPLKAGWLEEWGHLTLTRDRAARILASFSSGSRRGGKDDHKESAIAVLQTVIDGRCYSPRKAVTLRELRESAFC